jgi:hypothetical protein
MATAPRQRQTREIDYPASDGKPMAETEVHLRDIDPTLDYLDPPLRGFRLARGRYVPIKRVAGRLPSQVLGLHLERDGKDLRLFNPTTGKRLLTPSEMRTAAERLAQENERPRREIEALRRGS